MQNKSYSTIAWIVGAALIIIIIAALVRRPAQAPAVSNQQSTSTPSTASSNVPASVTVPSASSGYGTAIPGPHRVYSPSSTSADIQVDVPADNAAVSSPILVSGSATSSWFFESVFPIVLTDSAGNVLAHGQAQAVGNWMVQGPVGFTGSLSFVQQDAQKSGSRGWLVLMNDNPSGDPAKAKSVKIPVIFK